MRGTIRLAAIGLVIGAVFMVTAPAGARANTPISIFELDSFPASLLGDAPLPERGLVVAFHQGGDPFIRGFVLESEFLEVRDQLVNLLPTVGIFVALGQGGLHVWPFFFNEDGLGFIGFPGGFFDLPADDPVGNPGGPGGPGGVTTAPEPATWIMMIVGFWIVAWRLRQRGRSVGGLQPMPA